MCFDHQNVESLLKIIMDEKKQSNIYVLDIELDRNYSF